MPRHSNAQEDDIVFEDLHGVSADDDLTLEVDLDAEGDDDGITGRTRTSSGDGTATGDEDDFDDEARQRGQSDDDDNDPDGRDDGDRFSKKFDQRLKREQRAKRRERQRAEAAEAENARLQAELRKQKKQRTSGEAEDIDKRITDIEADLEQAFEDGDTKKQVRLTSQLSDAKAEKIAARFVDDDDDDDDQTQQPPRGRQRNELAEDWIDSHSDWYDKRGFSRVTRIAKEIDREVFDDGFDPQDEEYYDELNSRLMEQVPELFDEDGNPDPDGMKDRRASGRRGRTKQRDDGAGRKEKRSRSTVASADDSSRDSAPRRGNSSKVELNSTDFENMRRFGLDPKDPKQVKEYALNKRQVEMEEANG